MLDTTTRGSARSIDSSLNNASADMKVLVKDAQALLTAAAAMTGEKADELRNRAAFEVQLRRAVIANRDALEAAVVDAQRRAAEATARIVGESSGGRP